MLYFAVARDEHDGGVADHGVAQPEAVQRREDGPEGSVSAERRRGHLRHPRHDCRRSSCRRRPRGAARSTTSDVLDRYVEHVMSFIDPAVIKPFNVVLDAGSGMGGLVAPKLFDRLPCRTTRLCFDIDGTLSQPRSQPAHRGEPPRHRRAPSSPRRRTSASPGTATPTAASSSTARANSSPATSSRRCSPKRFC